ncbi:MAG: TadE family protein [Microbacterium sp.]|uniref:TadE family protein n=1 Tax=Microbacterium sp. TaxID=51671 RepID=UPI0039E5D148
MPRPSLSTDAGSASLEFVVGGLLLLVPIVYLVVALGLIQQGALGTDAAARQIARAISLSADAAEADRRAQRVLTDIAVEYGLDPGALAVDVSCGETAGGCPEAGATITVTVHARIALPLVPPILGLDEVAAVPVDATSVQKVSRTWGGAP